MELKDYINILRKRSWIILLVAAVAAASALGFSLVQTPVYKATVKLSVNPARADWGLGNAVKDLLRNYVINIQTHKMAQRVIDRAQLDMSTYTLLSKVSVSSDASNFTIQIDVKDPDPAVAMQIAQTMADVFKEDRDAWNQKQDKRDRVDVSIVDDVREAPLFKPKKKINTLAGGIFGALLGGVIVFFLEWLESDIIRTAEDVERHVGLTVIGAIPVNGSHTAPGQRRRTGWRLLPGLNPALVAAFGVGLLVGGVAVGVAFMVL